MNGLQQLGNALGNFAGSPLHALGFAALAVVFVWSGFVKRRHVWMTAMAMMDFGVTARPRLSLGHALAVGEVALGLALASSLWAPGWAAVIIASVAALLLATFTMLIALALRDGASFPCYCFGDGEGHISRTALARTAALAALAVALAVGAAGFQDAFSGEERLLGLVAGLAAVGTVVLAARTAPLLHLPAPPESRAATILGPAE